MRLPTDTSRFHFESLENRRLLSFGPAVNYPVGVNPLGTVASDFNNDGRLDLAVANYGSNTILFVGGSVDVLLGTGNGSFQAARTSAVGDHPVSLVAGDLNGDGKMDLVTSNLSLLLGKGDGFFQAPRSVALPPQRPGSPGGPLAQTPRSAVICDLNADGRLDLVAGGEVQWRVVVGYDGDTGQPIYQDVGEGYLNVLLGNGNGTFAPATVYLVGSWDAPRDLAVGDFDGNGKLDVVTDAGGVVTFLGNGDGTLQTPRGADSGYVAVPSPLPVADFNRDGKLDLLMRDGTGTAVIVMLGNGDGTFRQTPPMFVGSLHSAAVGDVNADGKADVVVLNSNYTDYNQVDWASSAHVLLGRGDGTFAPEAVSELGVPPDNYFRSGVLADFDGDGYPDLASAASASDYDNDYQGIVAVAHNVGNWATKIWIGPTSGGNWSTAANWSPSGVPMASDLVTLSGKSVNLSASATVASLTLVGGATLTLESGGNRVLRTSSSSISNDSTLNLNDNALIVDYSGASPLDSIRASLHNGYAGGAWNGTGITSAAAATNGGTGIGFAEASDLFSRFPAAFAGQSVDDTSVLLRYTLLGDANQDGGVDVTDLGILATNWQGTNKTVSQGDFNYDGFVDVADLGLVATNWQKSLGTPPPAVPFGRAAITRGSTQVAQDTIFAGAISMSTAMSKTSHRLVNDLLT